MSYKYEVLYTKDIHKKSQNRKWVDGYAEFNINSKKLSVYDEETRQYVVSSHLKAIDFDVQNPDGEEKRIMNYDIQILSCVAHINSNSGDQSASTSSQAPSSSPSSTKSSTTATATSSFSAPRPLTTAQPTITSSSTESDPSKYPNNNSSISTVSYTRGGKKKFQAPRMLPKVQQQTQVNEEEDDMEQTSHYQQKQQPQQRQRSQSHERGWSMDDDDNDDEINSSSMNQYRPQQSRSFANTRRSMAVQQVRRKLQSRAMIDDDDDNNNDDDSNNVSNHSNSNMRSNQSHGIRNESDDDDDQDLIHHSDVRSRSSQISLNRNKNKIEQHLETTTMTAKTKTSDTTMKSRYDQEDDYKRRSNRALNDDDDSDDGEEPGIQPEDKVEVVTVMGHSGGISLDDDDDDEFDFNPSPIRKTFKPIPRPGNPQSTINRTPQSNYLHRVDQSSPSNTSTPLVRQSTPPLSNSGSITKNSPADVSRQTTPSFQRTPLTNNVAKTPSPNTKISPITGTKKFSPPLAKSPHTNNLIDTNIPILSIMQQFIGRKDSLWFPNTTVCNSFLQTRSSPKRSVLIPNKFQSLDEYKNVFSSAVYEDMNLQLYKVALKYRRAYKQITSAPGTKPTENSVTRNCPHGKMVLKTVKKEGPNKGRVFYSCPTQNSGCKVFHWADNESANVGSGSFVRHISNSKERMNFFRSSAVSYYHGCDFTQSHNLMTNSFKSKSNVMKYKSNVTQWYLRIDDKEQGSPYAKDDIWIISNDEMFDKMDNLLICRSVFHGPTSDGSIEVQPIFGKPSCINNSRTIYAIRGPNLTSELEMIENLETLNKSKLPILDSLLGDPTACSEDTSLKSVVNFDIGVPKEEIMEKAEKFITEYDLNEDQANVIRNSAKWFIPTEYSPDIHLVHGVFGAGKSFMLVVLILFLCELLDEAGNTDIRIMISSVTNVAVDRVLQGLITENCDNVLRVGSQRKIARAILPYTLISDKSKQEIVRDLNQMLKKSLDPQELLGVKKALKDVQSGALEKKKDSVKSVRVVGVTCAASAFEVLKGNKFPIMIIDESSQCVEPLALLPMARFGCQKLIAVGDPQQLSPTLSGSFGRDDPDSIEKTLFIRLSEVGFVPQMLRTQYRCHPSISALSNKMFYGGMLRDGIKDSDRSSLIYGMPPVLFVDVPNGKEQGASDGSFSNEEEVNCIVNLLGLLTQNESITKDTIGVISLYRSQKFQLKLALKKNGVKGIKISTVDAFQGGERDLIILTSCRTTNNLSFIENEKRLNVALSRAKRHLIIVGKQDTLENSRYWKNVILQAERTNNGISSSSRIQNISQIQDLFISGGSSRSYVLPQDMDDEEEIDFDKPLLHQLPKRQLIDDDDDDDEDENENYREAELALLDGKMDSIDKEEGEIEFEFGEEKSSQTKKKRSASKLIDDDDTDSDKEDENLHSSPSQKRRRIEDDTSEKSTVLEQPEHVDTASLVLSEHEERPNEQTLQDSSAIQTSDSIIYDNDDTERSGVNTNVESSSSNNKANQSIELDLDW